MSKFLWNVLKISEGKMPQMPPLVARLVYVSSDNNPTYAS